MTEYPEKLKDVRRIDNDAFLLSVAEMPALFKKPEENWSLAVQDKHEVTIAFPRYYPSIPCEVFLTQPLFHPNIDKVNGFVCLWTRHRVANTAVDALSKLAAVLSWRLFNAEAPHLMQPEALDWYNSSAEIQSRLPLAQASWINMPQSWESEFKPPRRRLS